MSDAYKKRYGVWAGNPAGVEPDFTRCCASLHDKFLPGGYQCTRPAKYGPGNAYCKQHDPEAIAARRKKADQEYRVRRYADMKKAYGPTFLAVLRQIAEGHNDPSSLAKETVTEFDQKYKPEGTN